MIDIDGATGVDIESTLGYVNVNAGSTVSVTGCRA